MGDVNQYVFGDFRLDVGEKTLLEHGVPVLLPQKAMELLIAPGTKARITMSFDEYWLEVTTEYQGKPLVTGGAAPTHDELLADETQLTRLAAVMIRRLATRLTTTSDGDRQRIRLGFEH